MIKNSKKPQINTWQSLFMTVNDLNGVSKKGPNWTKLMKIGTYLNIKPKLWLIWQNLTKIGIKKIF